MNKVYDFLFKKIKFIKEEPIIVGISGGPDSMVLLYLLIELRKQKNIHIICAHVNHGLRKESETEKEFVSKYCEANNITFEYMKIKEYSATNFHSQARVIRYQFFETLIKKYNAKYLLTAHHGDDLMETILMRIVRGSTLKGYSGFAEVTKNEDYTILRPLIFISKEQVLQFAKEKKIKYCLDKSNLKDEYTRNRYRKYILPFFKKEEPNVNEKFLKFSETLQQYNNYIDKTMRASFAKIYINKTLDLKAFNQLDDIIKQKIINNIFELIYDTNLSLINDNHTMLLINMINSPRPNSKVYLPEGFIATKAYDILKIDKEVIPEDYKIELQNTNNLPNGKNIDVIDVTNIDDNNICRLNYKDIKLPLYIRNRTTGDKIAVKGKGGTQKIKDIFIDEKIAALDRKLWPLLVDSNNIVLWVPGIKKSKLNQPKDKNCDIILRYY